MAEAAKKIDPPEEAKKDEVEQEIPQSVKPVGVNRFGLREQHANNWRINCKVETDPDDPLAPEFYEHISRHLNRGDTIEVMPDDMRWKLVLHVHDRGHNWAAVKKLSYHEFGEQADPENLPTRYVVKWAGTTDKFQVLFNGKKLKAGFATEKLAQQYAANHADAVKR